MTNDGKPEIKRIDPTKFIPGLEGLKRLGDMLGDLEAFASNVKTGAAKADDTLNKLSDFTQKFGETVFAMKDIVDMNKKLFDQMLKNAQKHLDDMAK